VYYPLSAHIRQHTSAYVSIRQQSSAYVSIHRFFKKNRIFELSSTCAPGFCCADSKESIEAKASLLASSRSAQAYVSSRQHTSTVVSIRQRRCWRHPGLHKRKRKTCFERVGQRARLATSPEAPQSPLHLYVQKYTHTPSIRMKVYTHTSPEAPQSPLHLAEMRPHCTFHVCTVSTQTDD